MRIFDYLSEGKVDKQSIINNQTEVMHFNYLTLKKLTTVFIVVCILIFLISLLVPSYYVMRVSYGITLLFVGMSALLVKKVKNNFKQILYLLYFMFILLGLFCIYLSVDVSPDSRATIILGMLCSTPLLIVDTDRSVNGFIFIIFLLHIILSFCLKSNQIFVDDLINSLVFLLLGCIVGNSNRRTRINNFELHRQTMELADVDFLTGLYNRRKMYDYIVNDNKQPIKGIVLFDIDDFKGFNDYYGHQKGDECLSRIGSFLNEFGKQNQMVFFRFGGEEFLGFDFSRNYQDMNEITELLRQQVFDLNISYSQHVDKRVTVSIGCTIKDHQSQGIEQLISLADKALYKAKSKGKNCCVGLK